MLALYVLEGPLQPFSDAKRLPETPGDLSSAAGGTRQDLDLSFFPLEDVDVLDELLLELELALPAELSFCAAWRYESLR